MDVQTVIDTATTANAVALGNGPVTELFRECIRNNIKITTNCCAYVRRRMCGMSLVNAELLAPWDLPKPEVLTFCLTVTAYVKLNMNRLSKYSDPEVIEKAFGWWKDKVGRVSRFVRATFRQQCELLYNLIFKKGQEEDLVKFPDHEMKQSAIT